MPLIFTEVRNTTGLITLNRPKGNALIRAFFERRAPDFKGR